MSQRDCKTCKFSERRPFEDNLDAIVCMKTPPVSHPLYVFDKNNMPVIIGTASMRAPLSPGEWCYQHEIDLLKTSSIVLG